MKEILFRAIFYLILIFEFINCINHNHESIDCDYVKEMSKLDQLYRNDKRCNPIVYIIDSLSNHDSAFYENNYEKALNIYRAKDDISFTKGFINKEISDSLSKLQFEIDKVQVKKVSRWLTNIEKNRIDTLECYFDIFFILAHTPIEMRADIQNVVNMKKSYISSDTYDYLIKALSLK